jgi:hypothetical protein
MTAKVISRGVDNIVCKVFCRHIKKNSNGMFYDILVPKQNLYSVQGNKDQVMSADGKAKRKMKGDKSLDTCSTTDQLAPAPRCGTHLNGFVRQARNH